MMHRRLLLVSVALTGLAAAAGESSSLTSAAERLEQLAGKLSPPLDLEFRMLAAEALQTRHPELARKFVDTTLAEVRTRHLQALTPAVIRALADLAPAEAIATLPDASPGSLNVLIAALAPHHLDRAIALYRESLAHGKAPLSAAGPVLAQLGKDKPAEAAKLFQDSVAAVSFDPLDPMDGWTLMNLTSVVARLDPKAAAGAVERVLSAAAAPGYGEKSKSALSATFQTAGGSVDTANARDTLLVAAGARLQSLAPERTGRFKEALSRWDLSKPVTLKALRTGSAVGTGSGKEPPTAPIRQALSQFRGLPTDADRARLALEVSAKIRELPAGAEQLGLAQGLCNLSTEGDLGKEAMAAVGATLGQAIRDGSGDAGNYLELASLVRYEHIPAPPSLPALEAAGEVLALRERLVQENGFTLTGMDGRSYTLSSLRGRVVLLNFWATWCPPCRREMPDMEKLYHSFADKGFVVLAVSDEDRETVAGFLEKQKYTFPVLLDKDRAVNIAFNVEGIPKSFLFDREGKLVAQAMDMRTERQFLEMLKMAGLE